MDETQTYWISSGLWRNALTKYGAARKFNPDSASPNIRVNRIAVLVMLAAFSRSPVEREKATYRVTAVPTPRPTKRVRIDGAKKTRV